MPGAATFNTKLIRLSLDYSCKIQTFEEILNRELMTEIQLSYVTIRYEKPIVYFMYKEGAELGFPEIKELISYAEELSGHKPYVTFSDVTAEMNITEEGKRYVDDPANMPLFRGTAALVKNSMFQMGANIMSSFSRKKYPFKAFTEKQKAIDWLLSLPL